MSAGDLLATEYQYEFRNYLFGSGTDIIVEKMTGLLALPGTTDTDVASGNEHGTVPGTVLMTKRIVSFDLKIAGSAGQDIEEKLREMQATFQLPRKRYYRKMEQLVFWRPGSPKKMVNCRCTKRDFASTFEVARGLAAGSVELQAPDPLIYSLEEYSETETMVGAANQVQVNATMNGDFPDGAYPIIEITGPATDPTFSNTDDDNRQIRISGTINAGQTLRIDVKEREASINGVVNYGLFRSDNQWWALVPGLNRIVYQRQGGAADSNVTVSWRDTWA